jgi:hypothetical protein
MRLNASDEARPVPNLDSRPVEMLFGYLDCLMIVRAHDHVSRPRDVAARQFI